MHPHLTEDELIAHFYGDADRPDQEAAVDAHLQTCQMCRTAFGEIMQSLKMADAVTVPEPDAGFEQAMWSRIQAALPHEPPRRSAWESLFGVGDRHRLSAWLIPAAGLAAAVIIAVVAGRTWKTPSRPGPETPQPAVVRVSNPAVRERVLLTALGDHFQRSERLLVEVMNGDGTPGQELGFERQTADELLESGRLYRQTAQQNGSVRLAQMLEDLESVLVEIARSPDQVDRKDFHSLRARIDGDDLLFKVRAVSKQIEDRQKSLATE